MPEIPNNRPALVAAIATYTGKNKVNAVSIGAIVEGITRLLDKKWAHVCDLAHDDLCDGKVAIGFRVQLNFARKMPTGTIVMSFSKRTTEDMCFSAEDPDQATLPFDGEAPEAPRVTATSPTAPPIANPVITPAGIRRRRVPSTPLVPLPAPTTHTIN